MDWLKTFHEDHKEVLVLLAKLEGNLLDLKAGLSTPNTYVEFREFVEVMNNVIIPHFREEEKGIYQEVAQSGPAGQEFIDDMLVEHQTLYNLFERFQQAVANNDHNGLIETGEKLNIVLHHHIIKEEDHLPRFLT